MQSLDCTDPVGDLGVSLGQSVHRADPVDALYFPATHAVQLKAGPDEPAWQVHVVEAPHPSVVQRSGLGKSQSPLYRGETES